MAHFPLVGYTATLPEESPSVSSLSFPDSAEAPSDLDLLASLASTGPTSHPHDQKLIDLQTVRTEVTSGVEALQNARSDKRGSIIIASARRELKEIVNRGMELLGQAVTHFRGKCEWVSALPLANIETRLVSSERRRPKKGRRKARTAVASCNCILAARKRMKRREFRQALESGAIMCTCKPKRE